MNAPDLHDRAFFAQMATCRDAYRRLGDSIHDVAGSPGELLDLGAGLGAVAARLVELGWNAVATDLLAPHDLRETGCTWVEDWRSARGIRWDLTKRLDVAWRWDWVMCTETAEHIAAEHADQIVENVARLATMRILWSAAPPGQDWPGHVNLQPPRYWLDRFLARGWRTSHGKTETLRRSMLERNAQHVYARDNFYVLVPC